MKYSLVLGVVILFLYSCTGDVIGVQIDRANSSKYDESLQLVRVDSVTFHLDSLSSFSRASTLQYVEISGESCLGALNLGNSSIDIYSYENGLLRDRVDLRADGPDGVGKIDRSLTFFILGNDRIVVLNNWAKKIYLFDFEGNKLKTIDLFSELEARNIIFEGSNNNPITLIDGELWISTTPNLSKLVKYSELTSQMRIDTATWEIDYSVPFSQLYDQHYWGDTYFKYYSTVVKGRDGKMKASFPIDP